MSKITHITSIILLLASCPVQSQNSIKEYVKENTVEIDRINPYTGDFTDLESFGNAIGDAKIVMLGEQDHGDAAAFLAKTWLIKYLHEVKGFNVLAFESDFFALNEGWENLNKNSNDIDSFIRGNIFPLWTACDGCQELFFNYIPATFSTENPLQLSGFDSQLFLNHSYYLLREKLDSVMRHYKLSIVNDLKYDSEILPLIDSTTAWPNHYADSNLYYMCDFYFRQIRTEMLTTLKMDDFWVLIMDNLLAANQEFKDIDLGDKSYEVRDLQMAKNIAWLNNVKYPDEKIIIWAHNYHISKQYMDETEKYYGETSMGGYMSLDTALIAQTYVLGFTSYNGTTGRVPDNRIYYTENKKRSFEGWVDETYNYGFIDFKNFKGDHNKKFVMKGELHEHSKEAWMTKYDGYFYMKTMFPCIDLR